jgi:hypothetical protein
VVVEAPLSRAEPQQRRLQAPRRQGGVLAGDVLGVAPPGG